MADREIAREGRFRAEKVQYSDGIGCCVWEPLGTPDDPDYDENCGIGFDFVYEEIDDLIGVLEELKEMEARPFDG